MNAMGMVALALVPLELFVVLCLLSRDLRAMLNFFSAKQLGILPFRRLLNNARTRRVDEGGVSSEDFAMKLQRLALEIYGAFIEEGTGRVDYGGIQRSSLYSDYLRLVNSLNSLDVSCFDVPTKTAFFINIYNCMLFHARIVVQPTSKWQMLDLFSSCSYCIGGHILTLDEIENGILRGNRRSPLSRYLPFDVSDRRLSLAIPRTEVDFRIHFALNCGALSCPTHRVYSAEHLDTQLAAATSSFCSQSLEINATCRTVHCSELFKWYWRDFGGSVGALLRNLRPFLGSQQGGEADALLREQEGRGDVAVAKWIPYDWQSNAVGS